MHILVTGGSGFIGRVLCQRLLEQGHQLTLLSRSPAKTQALFGQAVGVIGNLQQLPLESRFQAVINLAGEPIMDARWTAQRKQALLDSRVGITRQLLDFMAKAEQKPKVLLSGSAIGWYGDQGDMPLNETFACDARDFGQELCRQWEQTALQAQSLGVRVCLLRTGLVVGKDGGFLARMLPLFRLGLGGRIGHGKQWMSWIHRDDHIAIMCKLLDDASLSGAFNLTAPQPATNAEFTQTLAAALQRPALLPVPAGLLKLALGEMAELLLGGQRVLPERIEKAGYRFKFPSLDAALRDVLA